MANPLFPDVPLAPGVPPVNRLQPFVQVPAQRLTKDANGVDKTGAVQWGIFGQKGGLAVKPDSLAAFEFQREYRIAEYPLEQGDFESYNKVTLPYDIRVVMTKGGSVADRKTFLETIDAITASLDLYTIVTPERAFTNANLVRQDYKREAESGVSLITVELHATEVRTQASVQFVSSPASAGVAGGIGAAGAFISGDTHAPSGADPRSNGSVQAAPPTEAPAFRPAPSFVGG